MCRSTTTPFLQRSLARASVALLAILAALAPATAQSRSKFDPERDLAGYKQRIWGDYAPLYRLPEITEKRYMQLTAPEIAALRTKWLAHRARIDAEVEAIRADPRLQYLYKIECKLRKHRFFREISYSRNCEHLPLAFYIERPLKPQPGYESRVVARFAPWLTGLEAVFLSQYVTPLTLHRNPKIPCHAIAILNSGGSYRNFANAVHDPGLYMARAHYDPLLELAVTFEPKFRAGDDKMHAILHEFVHALVHAHFSGKKSVSPTSVWFSEGLAEYLAGGRARSLDHLARPTIDERALKHLVLYLADPDARLVFYNRLFDLVTIEGPGYQAVVRKAAIRAGLKRVSGEFVNSAMDAFYAQSGLLMHFLHRGQNGRYREYTKKYIARVMRGETGWKPFRDAFAGVRLRKLEDEFLEFLWNEYRRAYPGGRLPPTPTVKLLRSSAAERTPVETSAPLPQPPVPSTVPQPTEVVERPAFEPSELDVGGRPRLAAAVHLARRGELDLALAMLDATKSSEGPDAELAARERSRLQTVVSQRDAYLRSRIGKKLSVKGENRRYLGDLVKIEAGKLYLRAGKAKFVRPISEFDAEQLERRLDKRSSALAPWLRGYLAWLANESRKRIERTLGSQSSTKSRKLLADLDSLEGLEQSGAAAAALVTLADTKLPGTPEQAAQLLPTLERLLRDHGESDLVAPRKDVLRRYAEFLLDVSFEPSNSASLGLHGKLTPLRNGRVRVRYDFANAEQAEDFVAHRDPLADARDTLPELEAPGKAGFKVNQGRLEGIGASCVRFVLPISPPFTVKYSISAEGTSDQFLVGVCADGFGNLAYVGPWGSISVFDKEAGVSSHLDSRLQRLFTRNEYHHEIRYDGSNLLTSKIDGKEVCRTTKLGNRRGGYVVLWTHSNHSVRLSELEIEAKLDVSRLGKFKRKWIEKRVATMFGAHRIGSKK